MEPKKVFRILADGEKEEVFATELKVGERFFDETRKQEGIVVRLRDGSLEYRLPDGTISLSDLFRG